MQKKVLSEIGLYNGLVNMPKGFEIDRHKLHEDVLQLQINKREFPFSKEWDKLNTYLREHINVQYNVQLINKTAWGNVYKPKEFSMPFINVDPVDLKNSPDYTLLYGVNVKDCTVRVHYDDNRRKGRHWDMSLKNNQFIMFPSTQMYCIANHQEDSFNSILTITYEFK
jgi:hypothetical protein